MLFQPKKTKYRKYFKPRQLPQAHWGESPDSYGLMAIESAYVSARQLEAARQNINRKLKRKGRLKIRVFPDLPLTRKPTEVRMGKGKGNIDYWIARVRAGRMIFHLTGVNTQVGIKALQSGGRKLPFKVKVQMKEKLTSI
uniref:Ribosomal protein L16 n=1 Tax=Schizocladia ischiensis TaxID=196139 RepID=A0A7S6ZPC6_9STRA|nr:ribosomal protein L16 [Schizocladia ischiensis]QOW07594.1 ribosomal protein L16 [Schizocladia ischiensis]